MNRHAEKTFPGQPRVARGVSFPNQGPNERESSLERATQPRWTYPLPPTRAARTPRSRGTFLDSVCNVRLKRNALARASLTGFTLVVGGILLALFAYSPSIVSGGALNANPGPGMFASASVAPAFMVPAKRR